MEHKKLYDAVQATLNLSLGPFSKGKHAKANAWHTFLWKKGQVEREAGGVMTVRLELLFFFTFPFSPSRCAHLLLPLSITCSTFTATVPFTCASVPADA